MGSVQKIISLVLILEGPYKLDFMFSLVLILNFTLVLSLTCKVKHLLSDCHNNFTIFALSFHIIIYNMV